jgi:hypothetical protein
MWQQWVNLILGLWVIVSGFLNLSPSALATDLTVTGVIIAALALWGALEYQSKSPERSYRT